MSLTGRRLLLLLCSLWLLSGCESKQEKWGRVINDSLVRTEAPSEDRHAGLSQIVIDLRNDGVQIRPIKNIAGAEDFNEVVFEDVLIPADRVVGEPGNGCPDTILRLRMLLISARIAAATSTPLC